jgi:hypothetical protein
MSLRNLSDFISKHPVLSFTALFFTAQIVIAAIDHLPPSNPTNDERASRAVYDEFQAAAAAALRTNLPRTESDHFVLTLSADRQCVTGLEKSHPTPPSDAWRKALTTCKTPSAQ